MGGLQIAAYMEKVTQNEMNCMRSLWSWDAYCAYMHTLEELGRFDEAIFTLFSGDPAPENPRFPQPVYDAIAADRLEYVTADAGADLQKLDQKLSLMQVWCVITTAKGPYTGQGSGTSTARSFAVGSVNEDDAGIFMRLIPTEYINMQKSKLRQHAESVYLFRKTPPYDGKGRLLRMSHQTARDKIVALCPMVIRNEVLVVQPTFWSIEELQNGQHSCLLEGYTFLFDGGSEIDDLRSQTWRVATYESLLLSRQEKLQFSPVASTQHNKRKRDKDPDEKTEKAPKQLPRPPKLFKTLDAPRRFAEACNLVDTLAQNAGMKIEIPRSDTLQLEYLLMTIDEIWKTILHDTKAPSCQFLDTQTNAFMVVLHLFDPN